MRSPVSMTVGTALALLCSGCEFEVSTTSPRVKDIVLTRPASHIALSVESGQWRRIEISIAKKTLPSLRQRGSTLHVEISDCAGKPLTVEDFYAGGVSTAQLSTMEDPDFKSFYATLSDTIVGYIYLKEQIYENEDHICAFFSGGSMIGTKVVSSQLRIK